MSDEPLSPGEIAWTVAALEKGEKRPEDARRLYATLVEQRRRGESWDETAVGFLASAFRRIREGADAVQALGLKKADHRPAGNEERDELIALSMFLLRENARRKGERLSVEKAAQKIADDLAEAASPPAR